jgi:hypothetical protein
MMTVGLAGCAFVLSFDSLRDLAISLGFHPDRAWLWPVAIDVSIAQSTLALLTLAPRRRSSPAGNSGTRALASVPSGRRATPALTVEGLPSTAVLAARWKTAADRLVREGVTSKDPALVAAILAEHAAGTPPSTIGRRRNVHHSTVNRIVSAAQSASI